jgi:hypothetical protein
MIWVTIRKAKGVAEIMDYVRYSDIANQNGDVFRVVDYPKAGRILDNGFQLPDIGYRLVNVESEELITHYSDLRQHGWDVLEKLEV